MSGDEQISRDFNAAVKQLKSRWSEQDPTSMFEHLKGKRVLSGGKDGEYRLFLVTLALVAVAGFWGVKMLIPRLAAHLRPANGFRPPVVEKESSNPLANVPAPPVTRCWLQEVPLTPTMPTATRRLLAPGVTLGTMLASWSEQATAPPLPATLMTPSAVGSARQSMAS